MASWKGKKVAVTGAGGFIGSHLVERLVKEGAEVSCLVRYNSMNAWGWIDTFPEQTKKAVKVTAGDLRDSDCVRNFLKGQELVFHLGALIPIPYSYVNPRDVIQTNVLGTLNVLQGAREHDVKVIHTSTSETYGTAQYVPIDEKHQLQAQSPYAASKIGADKIAESFFYSYGLPVAIVRPFNTYGPRQSARAIIPTIITQLLDGTLSLGNLEPTRDLTYVSDTVDGFLKIAESPKALGQTLNLGVSEEISIGDLAKKIQALMGKKAKITADAQRQRRKGSEVERLLSDNRKAKQLGWKPKVELDEGLKLTIDWIKKNRHYYKPGYTI
ncbi:MAG: SDR family NAD(P)-dependent oxidoreductase [Nanoarchaeota archaeon]|nr:SDR family NAD(P)-dependent oxidoreductase [Nanoarchaeota archaeon]